MTPETRMSKVRAVALAGTLLAMPQHLAPPPDAITPIDKRLATVGQLPQTPPVLSEEQTATSLPEAVATRQASVGVRLLSDAKGDFWFAPAIARVPWVRNERFTITAYAVRRIGRVMANARTKTGAVPQVGCTVAVDPRVIPLGTRLHIEGIGVRIAEDTGRDIKGRRIDLFVHSTAEGRRFGVRRGTKVHVLASGDSDPTCDTARAAARSRQAGPSGTDRGPADQPATVKAAVPPLALPGALAVKSGASSRS
jgi:3D (Asp-Asp-Asp) domain-containing protein